MLLLEVKIREWRDRDLRDTIMTRTMNLKPYTPGANRATATIHTEVEAAAEEEVTIMLRVTDAPPPEAEVVVEVEVEGGEKSRIIR